MNKYEVLEALCELSSKVCSMVFKNKVRSTCFCDSEDLLASRVHVDPKVIEYIKTAVKEKMERESIG